MIAILTKLLNIVKLIKILMKWN